MVATELEGLTLEGLAEEVQRLLHEARLLSAQEDARVSAAPDARTVRYYTTLGLLDRPAIVGRQARYGRRHALQLFAVKALQSEGMPLSDIQQRLYGRSDKELLALAEALASQAQEIEPPPPAFRALREVALEPGCTLVFEEGWVPKDAAAVEEKVRAVIAALQRAPHGAHGGKR